MTILRSFEIASKYTFYNIHPESVFIKSAHLVQKGVFCGEQEDSPAPARETCVSRPRHAGNRKAPCTPQKILTLYIYAGKGVILSRILKKNSVFYKKRLPQKSFSGKFAAVFCFFFKKRAYFASSSLPRKVGIFLMVVITCSAEISLVHSK